MTEPTMSEERIQRRRFLRHMGAAAALASGIGLPAPVLRSGEPGKKALWAEDPTGPYAPFRMAIQSYSLRKFDFRKTIDTIYDLQLNLVDLWPEHFPMTLGESDVRSRLRAMRQNVLGRVAYGVVEFTKDHAANRLIFEFAKRLNVFAITANPAPDSFESLDKLVDDFRIMVAIHNHGPEDKRYGTPDLIEKALKDHNKRIGLCIDTGHFLSVGVKPVDVLKAFKGRVYAVHLKDLKPDGGKWKETILGQGELDLVGFLKALKEKETDYKGALALEYELEPDDPVPSIKKGLAAVEAAVKKL